MIPPRGAARRWYFLIGSWVALLVIVAFTAYTLSDTHAEPRAVRIAAMPNPSATIVSAPAEPTASPTAVSLAEVQGRVAADASHERRDIAPTVGPLIVGAMLVIVFLATSLDRT
jgi:hypothetical protein